MASKNSDFRIFDLLSADLNKITITPRHIHLMGICGTGMASLAGILKQQGYSVTGSDQNIYPPMSHFLENLSIPVLKGYSPGNLAAGPDLVVVGNVITKHNPEAIELARLKIPYLSLPQALRHFAMDGKKSIVISGTHGKTTTSAIISWILEETGFDPGFMVGGILNNFSRNYKLGEGPYFVVEGDEYDTAFFDKGPKFLHYAPFITILTSIEFDHADIYRDIDHVIENFGKLIDIIPADGLLLANGDEPTVIEQSKKRASCPVLSYGLHEGACWRAVDISNNGGLTRFKALKRGEEYASFTTHLYGRHNISNLLSAIALSEYLEIAPSDLARAIADFRGVKRRQEIRGDKDGILVIDDFAHHPTAVEKTINAVKGRYDGRRVMAVFEPRSNSSRRKVFQDKYSSSFDKADLVFIPEPPMMEKIPVEERFSSPRLVESLKKIGLKAFYCPDTDYLVDEIASQAQKGDVILIMSNGSFDNVIDRLLNRL